MKKLTRSQRYRIYSEALRLFDDGFDSHGMAPYLCAIIGISAARTLSQRELNELGLADAYLISKTEGMSSQMPEFFAATPPGLRASDAWWLPNEEGNKQRRAHLIKCKRATR